jgi:hypothetical protein
MRIKKNGNIIRLTESDLKRIVKRVLTEDAPNPGQEHKKEIEAFMKCPTDAKARQKAKERLEDDAYSKKGRFDTNFGKGTKGAVNIKYNGREMDVESFLSEIESDYAEDGKCKDVIKFNYKNRMLGKTTIDIETTDKGKCKCKEEPKKEEPKPDKGSGDKEPKKSSCNDPKYLKNSLKVGEWFKVPGQDEEEFWRLVIPKMGSSKESMCKCWRSINPRELSRMEREAVYDLCIRKKHQRPDGTIRPPFPPVGRGN